MLTHVDDNDARIPGVMRVVDGVKVGDGTGAIDIVDVCETDAVFDGRIQVAGSGRGYC